MALYTDSELDPVVHAEILVESARIEARIAILEILLVIAAGVFLGGFGHDVFRGIAIFCLATVVPLLIDSALRRSAAKKVMGAGPQLQS